MPVSPADDDAGVRTSDQDAADLDENSQDSEGAESSTAGDEDSGPKDMLDAVQSALEDQGESSDPDGGQEEGADGADASEADKAEGAEEEDQGELTDEELRRYKPKTRRRMERLLDRVETLKTEAEKLRPAAERMQSLTRYMTEAGLSTEDVNNGFEVMRLVKTDPVKALEALEPMVAQLRKMTGHELPADLQQRVAGGYISEAEAKELSRLRAGTVLTEEAKRREAAQAESRKATEAAQARAAEVGTAVSAWEREWAKSDPDYGVKKQRVLEKVKLAAWERAQQGRPLASAEEAVTLAKECRAAVEKELKQFMPKPRESNPVTGASSTRSTPAPKDYLEAVLAGAGQ